MPNIFGIFAIALVVVGFFGFFGDLGLGAALIRKKEITNDDIKTVFTIQQLIALISFIALFASSFLLGPYFGLADSVVWLVRALSVTFFITSLGVIPTILLKRKLEFKQIVISEVMGMIFNYAIVISLAYLGYGVWSFIPGVIISRIISVIYLNYWSRWRITLGIKGHSAKELLSFGVRYQTTIFLYMLNSSGMLVLVGVLSGASAAGYLKWAITLGSLSITFLSITLMGLLFPAYSRLQDDKIKLKKGIEKTMRYSAMIHYPMCLILMAVAPYFVQYVLTGKWLPLLPAYYLIVAASLVIPLNLSAMDLFYAFNKPKIVLNIVLIWTVIIWIFGSIFIYLFGFVGFAMANLLTLVTLKYQLGEMLKIVKIDFLKNVLSPFLSACIAASLVFLITLFVPVSFILMILLSGIGVAIYALFLILFEGKKVLLEIKDLIGLFKASLTRQ